MSVMGACADTGILQLHQVGPDGATEELANWSYVFSGQGMEGGGWAIDVESPFSPHGQDVGLVVTAAHVACQDVVSNGTSILPDQFAPAGEEGPIFDVTLVGHAWHAPIPLVESGNSVVQTDNRAVFRERRFAFEIPEAEVPGRRAGQTDTQILLHLPKDHQFNLLTDGGDDVVPVEIRSPKMKSRDGSHTAFDHVDFRDGGQFELLLIHVQTATVGPLAILGVLFVSAGLFGPPAYAHHVHRDYRKRFGHGALAVIERRSARRAAAAATLLFAAIVVWLAVQRPMALFFPWPISPSVATFFVLTLGVLLLLAFIHQTIARGHARHLDASLGASQTRSSELESIAYGATHDLKAPLTGLNWLIADLEDQMAKRAPKTAELLGDDIERIRGSVDDMGSLLEDLLALIRLESDAFPVEPVELDDAVATVVGGLDSAAAARGGRIEILDRLPVVAGNTTLLRQMFHNLIDNAIKYGDQADGPAVQVSSETGPNAVRIFVDDNGPGIPPEHHEAVFGLLSKNPKEARPIEGTGIGLALVRRIARKHRGDVTIEDGPLGGARFVVRLPSDQ